jgi:glycosyltransferase involved in cell wall biosynthesis
MYKKQTYPLLNMEWIILDDGQENASIILDESKIPNLRYIRLNTKETMGWKLSQLCKEAKGEILVIMDDDDYYPPERVQEAVNAFKEFPLVSVAGCSLVHMYFTDDKCIYTAGPYHDQHALNCTLAFRKSYCDTHDYDIKETCAVESAFLNGFTEPMIQLDPLKTILHIVHSSNSFNAMKARKAGTLDLEMTEMFLEEWIPSPLRFHFVNAF